MLKPQNGSTAFGPRRNTPTAPEAAAVVSEPIVAPIKTPWVQSTDSSTSGTVEARRPPKMIAEIGTPRGSSACGDHAGLLRIGVVKRLLGCAALSLERRFHGPPCQSSRPSGAGTSIPSLHTSPSAVIATLVKIVSCSTIFIAFRFDLALVPGATPKYPFSGFTAHKPPSGPTRIHEISSPTVKTFQPFNSAGGVSIARLVLPHALGNAAAI